MEPVLDKFQVALSDEGRYRLLIEAVTDYAIYMLDPTGIVASWNPGAERFKGYTADEIVGQHFSRFYTEEDKAAELPARALQLASEEGSFRAEGWRVRKDGTRFWASVVIDPIRDSAGILQGFAKVTRDLTERRQAEEALEKTRATLLQSQKVESIGQLTGGIAHDFNNLLMAVLGSLELLSKRLPDDPQIKRLLNNAVQGAQRGATLTQRMLAFARRQTLTPVPVRLTDLMDGMTEFLRRSMGPGVEIETRFTVGLPPVLADANQVELALMNLVTNARDAMPDGGKILIEARELSSEAQKEHGLSPGHYVGLAVSDKGEGMDAQTLARAIEPFFTTKGVGKGTGLGLAMVHGMTEQMGGRLSIRSEKGVGTTAEMYFPAAPVETAIANEQAVMPQSRARRPLTVLAVDDDALVLLNTVAMLEDMGHTVLEAMSGAEALELVQKHAVDLVITDQAMPRMTGAQLLAAIRQFKPDLPVIVATGYAELPKDSPRAVAVLTKPFSRDQLEKVVAMAVPQ